MTRFLKANHFCYEYSRVRDEFVELAEWIWTSWTIFYECDIRSEIRCDFVRFS